MNIFSKTFFTAGLCATLALSGCTSDFGSINTDRNNPTEVTADLLLLPIMHTFIMDQFNYGDGAALAHQLSRTNYNETEQYAFGTNESTWSRYYLQLNDIQDMYNVAGKTGNLPVKPLPSSGKLSPLPSSPTCGAMCLTLKQPKEETTSPQPTTPRKISTLPTTAS